MTALDNRPQVAATTRLRAPEGDVTQIYCCDPDISICGMDISDQPFAPDSPDEQDCVVCVHGRCEFCGCTSDQYCNLCKDVP